MSKKDVDIEKLAELARIELTEEEKARYASEIGSILGYIERVQNADVGDARPADREVGVVKNVFRGDVDVHESGMYTKSILEEAPDTKDDFVKVKKIL